MKTAYWIHLYKAKRYLPSVFVCWGCQSTANGVATATAIYFLTVTGSGCLPSWVLPGLSSSLADGCILTVTSHELFFVTVEGEKYIWCFFL